MKENEPDVGIQKEIKEENLLNSTRLIYDRKKNSQSQVDQEQ